MKYLATIALLVIFAIGFGAATNSLPAGIHEFISFNNADKIMHFILIGGANGLAIMLIGSKFTMNTKLIIGITSAVLCLATIDEFVQKLFPHRTFSLKDLAANYLGILFFATIALIIVKLKHRKEVAQTLT